MVIKNISNTDFDFNFNFNHYSIPKNKMVTVSQELGDFLKERWPLSFSFDIEVKKPVIEVKSTPAKALIKREEGTQMVIPTMQSTSTRDKATFGINDDIIDGQQLEGEGLVYE